MSLRNWLSHPPVGVGLIIAALVIGGGVYNHAWREENGSAQEDAQTQEAIPAQPPSAVDATPSPPLQDSAQPIHEEAGGQKGNDSAHWWDLGEIFGNWSNVFIAAFTLVLTGVSIWQGRVLHRTLLATENSADAAAAAVKLSGDTSERELRAYVCAGDAKIILTERDKPKVRVVIRNYGQTPAYDLQQQICMFIGPYPPQAPLEPWSDQLRPSKHVLAPSDEVVMSVQRDPPVRSDAVHLLGSQDGTIYIFGEVRYRDAFGVDRYTKYRFIYGGLEPIDADRLKFDREGNEAD